MTVPSYAAMQASYARVWATLIPTAAHLPALTTICNRMVLHRDAYAAVSQTVWGKPDYWYIVGLLDEMEGGGGADTFLGNGQSLSRVTTEVPAGEGPFASFHDGAVRALHIDGLDKVTAWPVTMIAYRFEGYNGWGYLSKPIVDPYLASWSSLYSKGKWIADHVYDAEAVSQQPGALTILKVLLTIDTTIKLDAEPGQPPAKEPAPVTIIPAPTIAAHPATAAAPTATLHLDFGQIEKQVEGVLATINTFSVFLPPQFKGVLAFAPVLEGVLTLIGKLQATDWSHANIATVVSGALRDIASAVDASVPPAA
jgi:lysozyme family protein